MENDPTVLNVDDELDDELDPSVLTLGNGASLNMPKKLATPSSPMHHRIDTDALSTYIYPTNLQVRDYQYNIVPRAFFHNTLVVLPTGLGKTFIASTVILNYTRWFPDSKIVFMAPTRPLVAQQIKACCGITGLPPSSMAILLDLNRRNRASIWDEKKVFFTTPQVVENDLKLGTVSPKSIALLVIDEAHRAKGNYAYNNVVQFMDRFNPHYRILAMTATPASTVEGVQEIIDNLHISKAEVRTERSIDIVRYLKHKTIERFYAQPSDDIRFGIECICAAIAPYLKKANDKHIYEVRDPASINAFTAMEASRRLLANNSINQGAKWAGMNALQVIGVAGQCLRRLNIYGIRSFYTYFKEKYAESVGGLTKSGKKRKPSQFYSHPQIEKLMNFCEQKIADPTYLGHEKLEIVTYEVKKFFSTTNNTDSRVIVFSEFREAALDIVRSLEQSDMSLKPHIFIGQSKDSKSEEGKSPGPKTKAEREKAKEIAKQSGKSSSELAQLTGMTQKMQKETIKKFKEGVYNILVATSIGEEGLDIGEVDLIVCYDSTSSPIKNVQRMGRTGRNRDGKIILLFSGNEEFKFDKAMSGYEYIQDHTMNSNVVQLYQQNRLIPAEYTPTVEERFIEIPEENIALKEEADDDEIIKIATKYMTGGKAKPKAKSAKSLRGQPKIQKKFFMPDNVETGFQSVSALIRDPEDDEAEVSSAKRQKIDEQKAPDLLDLMLDSDLEDGAASIQNRNPPSIVQADESEAKNSETTLKFAPVYERANVVKGTGQKSQTPSQKIGQPQLEGLISSRPASRTASSSLGVRKRPLTIMDQLKAQKKVSQIEHSNIQSQAGTTSENSIIIDEDDDEEGEVEEVSKDAIIDEADVNGKTNEVDEIIETNNAHVIEGVNDGFSDDDEILALAQRTQSGDWKIPATGAKPPSPKTTSHNLPYGQISSIPISSIDEIDLSFLSEESEDNLSSKPTDLSISVNPQANSVITSQTISADLDDIYVLPESAGILSSEEWDDLYMNYYVPVDAYGLDQYAIPQFPTVNSSANYRGSRSNSYLSTFQIMETMTNDKAELVADKYERIAQQPLAPLKEVIEFE